MKKKTKTKIPVPGENKVHFMGQDMPILKVRPYAGARADKYAWTVQVQSTVDENYTIWLSIAEDDFI